MTVCGMARVWVCVLAWCVGACMCARSYYEVLGVSRDASPAQIRRAYRARAVLLHPDKSPESAVSDAFLELAEAYETLMEPAARRRYELFGTSDTSDTSAARERGLYRGEWRVAALAPHNYSAWFESGLHFVNFYSPFCPPCQALSEPWKEFARLYEGIVRVGAVNCALHASLCARAAVRSYPALHFYPDGGDGAVQQYSGARTSEALSAFVMRHVTSRTHVSRLPRPPPPSPPSPRPPPPRLLVREGALSHDALLRLAYRLDGAVSVIVVEELPGAAEGEWGELRAGDSTTRLRGVGEGEGEGAAVSEVEGALPPLMHLDRQTFQELRASLHLSTEASPWLVQLYWESPRVLLAYRLRHAYPHYRIGMVKCATSPELCAALSARGEGEVEVEVEGERGRGEVEWGVLKRGGGAWQAQAHCALSRVLLTAARPNLHTYSHDEANTLLQGGERGAWALAAVGSADRCDVTDHLATLAAQFPDIQWGVSACCVEEGVGAGAWRAWCVEVRARGGGGVAVREAGGGGDAPAVELCAPLRDLAHCVRTLRAHLLVELSESRALEISTGDIKGAGEGQEERVWAWLVAYLPYTPVPSPEHAIHLQHLRELAHKWSAVRGVRVGAVRCGAGAGGGVGAGAGAGRGVGAGAGAGRDGSGAVCGNVRAATLRLYSARHRDNHGVLLSDVPSPWEVSRWVLQRVHTHPLLEDLDSHTFRQQVLRKQTQLSRVATGAWLVYFHSPRCSHCSERLPSLAALLLLVCEGEGEGEGEGSEVRAGRVECLSQRAECREQRVTYYPTTRLYLPHHHNHQAPTGLEVSLEDVAQSARRVRTLVHAARTHAHAHIHNEL